MKIVTTTCCAVTEDGGSVHEEKIVLPGSTTNLCFPIPATESTKGILRLHDVTHTRELVTPPPFLAKNEFSPV